MNMDAMRQAQEALQKGRQRYEVFNKAEQALSTFMGDVQQTLEMVEQKDALRAEIAALEVTCDAEKADHDAMYQRYVAMEAANKASAVQVKADLQADITGLQGQLDELYTTAATAAEEVAEQHLTTKGLLETEITVLTEKRDAIQNSIRLMSEQVHSLGAARSA